jgi:uncharacterized protein DUF2490
LRRAACACSLLLLLSGLASAQAVDHTDNQFWSDVQFAVPIGKIVDFNAFGGLRLGRDISRPVDERIGAGFSFRFGKYLAVAPNYLYIGTQPFRGRRVWENRLSLPVTLRFTLAKLRLSERNLFERRLRHPGGNSTRYRNRFQVERPVGDAKSGLSLFVVDEVFYDWAVNRWVRNRLIAGASKVFNKHYTQEFYYLHQNDGVSIPGDLNVIGTTLRFRL